MIGIITPYKVNNYGTKLQAYAMQKLFEKYDKTELVGFVSATDRRISSVTGKIYIKTSKKFREPQKENRDDPKNIEVRRNAIASFDKNYNFGKVINGNTNFKKYVKNYDTVVCGSDQLWAPLNVFADYFTLSIIPSEINKISYAASFGVSEIPKNMEKKYFKFLNRLDSISVREINGKEIVKNSIGKDVDVVLDPTLMIDRPVWEKLSDKNNRVEIEKYIFCYFLGTNCEHRKFATELSKLTGYKLISIPHFIEFNDADLNFGDEQLYDINPEKFLNLINNAEYVCTDSFHGAVFSTIFNKQFAIFERFKSNSEESTNSRIYTLLDSLGTVNQLHNDEKTVQMFLDNPIIYDDVNIKLENLKKKSYNYVEKALKIK